ncbi:MAG: YceD family protein [Gammaproteobacteria bacterium]|nr:YceD family protein [Gammaproteobacteria bacterium]
MPERPAELVYPFRMARDGSSRRGKIALSLMPRASALLCNDQGEARFELDFHLDAQSRPVVTGRIQACVELICQRCLEPMNLELDLEVRLGIVRSDAEAVALPDEREPLLVEDGSVSLAALLEDELILGLPPAPLHPAGRCRPPGGSPTEAAASAVGLLAGLGPDRAKKLKG